MSQVYGVPQVGPVDPATMYDAIQDSLDALLSSNRGPSRPSYAVAGTVWVKPVSSTVEECYIYDGTSDILLFYINPTTHALTAMSLADNQVGLAKLAQVATARFLGRTTSGTGNVEALTATQATALLNAFTGDSGSGGVKGLVPAPAAGDAAADYFLHADGSWSAPPSGLDPGTIADFAMDTAPTGWLMCYGQAVSRATYAVLYAAIGDTWGAGNGSTTFNLPDLRGRVRAGWDNTGGVSANRLTGAISGLNGDTFAAVGGTEDETLNINQIPAHTHSETTITSGGGNNIASGANYKSAAANTGSAGGGLAHNNMQPTAIVLPCIKY